MLTQAVLHAGAHRPAGEHDQHRRADRDQLRVGFPLVDEFKCSAETMPTSALLGQGLRRAETFSERRSLSTESVWPTVCG